jgi:hypothetical protein
MFRYQPAQWIIALALVCAPFLAHAQAGRASKVALPRLADGHPDFSGVWSGRGHANLGSDLPGGIAPFTDAGRAAFAAARMQYDPTGFCLLPGVTRLTNSPYPIEIIQGPNRLAILYEYMRTFRIIPTDARAHSKDPNPNFFGETVGKWDGDTLVADVIGFNDRTWLDAAGNPHTEELHLTERYALADSQHLIYEVTIDDPKFYTQPWKSTTIFTRKPDWEIIEYSCDENNKDRDQHHFQVGPSFPSNRSN